MDKMKRVLLDNGNYLGEVWTLFKSDCQNRKRGKKQSEFMWYVVKDNALQLDLTSIAWLKFIN